MAATLVITINEASNTIQHIKDRVFSTSNGQETTEKLVNYLNGILCGMIQADVIVTIRDTDPTVTTSGTGSVQQTHHHK